MDRQAILPPIISGSIKTITARLPIRPSASIALATITGAMMALAFWLPDYAYVMVGVAAIGPGLLIFLMRHHGHPSFGAEEDAGETPRAQRPDIDPVVISHSQGITQTINHLVADFTAEVNANLPEGRFLLSPAEEILFLINELQDEHTTGTAGDAAQVFSPRELIDQIAGLTARVYKLDVFAAVEPEVPETVVGDKRSVASALFNLMLDEIASTDHTKTLSVQVNVLTTSSDMQPAQCHLCIGFSGRDQNGLVPREKPLDARISPRTRKRITDAGSTIEASLMIIPVIATEEEPPQLTGTVVLLTPDADEETALLLRLRRWGLTVVRNTPEAHVVVIGHRDQLNIERILKNIDQSTAILLHSDELFTNVTMMSHPLSDSELYRACSRIVARHAPAPHAARSKPSGPTAVTSPKLPMFDQALALARANHRPDLAEEFLDVFMDTIDDDQSGINRAYDRSDLELLKRRIHKLNGATRFCGLPRLNRVLSRLGKLAETGTREELALAMTLFNHEIGELRTWYDPHRNLFGTSLTRTETP